MNHRALRTFVFYCSNHLEAGRFSGLVREHEEDLIKTISLPCSGKVDIPYLLKAFETGADGVAIVLWRSYKLTRLCSGELTHPVTA
jgi:coenzyme F420-reducing hydrogenase delta subunit